MSTVNPQIESSWLSALYDQFSQPYFEALKNFLVEEKRNTEFILRDRRFSLLLTIRLSVM